MPPEPRRQLRCAIYTRKSSEEGLEQEFNSLQAQREACEAFISSQRHEGWRLIRTPYDDGGYSGGSMERPGIQALLKDVQARQIDVVVVYKVDRLTRSLSDFAKMVEAFDANGVSFVSVTQQFNTTTSMGRLTLNILLSFAQFEREVTGERIRDKFAASRRKGMWMGGTIPLGYDLKNRKLVVNAREAAQVREIFETYARVRCVRKLKAELEARGVRTKSWKSAAGVTRGGKSLSRGSLYNLLRNRLYLGEAVHKGKAHPGEHTAIVSDELWNKVQKTLEANRSHRKLRTNCTERSPLAGLIFDEDGNLFSPSHTSRNGLRYRYYVNQATLQHKTSKPGQIARLPAHELEEVVRKAVSGLFSDEDRVLAALKCQEDKAKPAIVNAAKSIGQRIADRGGGDQWGLLLPIIAEIRIAGAGLKVVIKGAELARLLGCDSGCRPQRVTHVTAQLPRILHRSRFKIIQPQNTQVDGEIQVSLLKSIARSHEWWNQLLSNPDETLESIAKRAGVCQRFVSQTLKLRFLSPAHTEQIVSGRTGSTMPVREMMCAMPQMWKSQRWPKGSM
ncbi:MAG: recombinase family protein [Alphaproteobacteria bacterium]